MEIDWRSIRPLNGSQNSAFEELVCQLAREEFTSDKDRFVRVAAPDGGVEAYVTLENGDEHGWQAKFFLEMESSQWQQIKKSFETALRTHPKMTKYYVCVPLDRQDPRDGKSWFMNKWEDHTKIWIKAAHEQDRDIEFIYWGSSELVHRLTTEKHAGRKLYWFSKEEFSDSWFEAQISSAVLNLGHRYTPELNVELDIGKYLILWLGILLFVRRFEESSINI